MGRHSQPKNRKGLKITGTVLASTLLLGGATAGVMYWNLNQRIQDNAVDISVASEPTAAPQVIEETVTVDEFDGAFNVLLVGNDDGNGDAKYGTRDHALNDVNILLHVSEDHTKATAISVPRDMFIDAPECTNPKTGETFAAASGIKINQSLTRGGLKCVVDTFRKMTGEPIDYAAMIQFNGVIALSNAVGGVPVCTTSAIDDPESGLKMTAGQHTISGEQALAFLRTRHGVGDGSDLARISNQQVFLSSLMKTLKSKDTLSDPKKIYEIANAAADNMTLSTNLASIPTLASLAYSLKSVPLEDITFLQYPTTYKDMNGESGVVPNADAAAAMVEAVFSDKSLTITGGTAPGSIGAVETKPTPVTTPSATPTATPTPTQATPTPTPSATKPTPSETPVALPSDVTGMNASQSTCSRGFGDY
jgi:LCP family protein required for cell wall assembly